ncbi:MAG: hypothetical protein WBZ29_16600 [Methanocella sp.]
MSDSRFLLWRNWLLAVCAVVIIFGLVIALLSWSPLFGIFNGLVNGVFWNGSAPDGNTGEFVLWTYGMLGATMAGWGVTLAFIVFYPFTKKERWAWNAIVLSLLLWFAVDTLMSAYTRAYFNVAINIILIIAAGIPLIMTRRNFKLVPSP